MTPLDDFFEQTGADASNFSDASLQALQYQKVQMMIPMQVHSTFLYWNKDLFEAAGLDPETPPATWEEAAEYALKISDPVSYTHLDIADRCVLTDKAGRNSVLEHTSLLVHIL